MVECSNALDTQCESCRCWRVSGIEMREAIKCFKSAHFFLFWVSFSRISLVLRCNPGPKTGLHLLLELLNSTQKVLLSNFETHIVSLLQNSLQVHIEVGIGCVFGIGSMLCFAVPMLIAIWILVEPNQVMKSSYSLVQKNKSSELRTH
jgi:hypothetical protein